MKHISPMEAMTKIGNFKYLNELRQLARQNRNNPTKSESLIWNSVLKNRKIDYLFLRQKPLGKFILDFYCSKLLLCIEIDGDSHDNKKYLDKQRDLYLEQRKIKTVRFKNGEVLNNIEKVKIDLKKIIKERELIFRSPFKSKGDLEGF
ncbi:MAG: endonuclease domain-containing protein [Candidatus Shapirobacteria bacterium]|nr:endonuclease domain-containing protein [Candidatus Shapirobacteria bacterium]